MKQAIFERLTRLFPDETVYALYSGVLHRAPDAKGLKDYREAVKRFGIGGVVADLVRSDEHWQKLIGARSGELVYALYQGLLGREPEAEALESYAAKLAEAHDLAPMLSEIARSDEHWEKTLDARASYLVRALYQGLLGREPEAEALENYAAKLAKTHDLKPLLTAIARSDEHWERSLAARANHLVRAAFLGLLGREPDPEALENYATKLAKTGDLAQLLSNIAQSDEHKRRYQPIMQERALGDRVEYINQLYLLHYGRTVSNIELSGHFAKDEPVWEIHRKLLKSSLRRKDKVRVIIFGAYGNGNIGDIYQAMAVREHLKQAWGLSDGDIFACSLLASSDYPFPENQKLPARAIYDFDLLNSFDCLVIGGGGLLAHPHDPLSDNNWALGVHIPVIVLAVGATKNQVPNHRVLLENALYLSARDEVSISALRGIRSEVTYAPDPILTVKSINCLTEFDNVSQLHINSPGILWILKYPSNERDAELLKTIKSSIENDLETTHTIVAIEPKLDQVLKEYFPNNSIALIDRLSDLMRYIANADIVFSMRYHGAIFALLSGRSVFGSSQSKIHELFKDFNKGDAYIEDPEDVRKILQKNGAIADMDKLAALRMEFQNALKKARPSGWGEVSAGCSNADRALMESN